MKPKGAQWLRAKVWARAVRVLMTVLVTVLVLESAARAEAPRPLSRARAGLVLGGKVGAGFGAPFNELGATPVFELELGYAPKLGFLERQLEVFVSAQYVQPNMEGTSTEADPRVPGVERFSYDVTQEMLSFALGALYRVDVSSDLLMPYGGFGGRLCFLRARAEGEIDGEPIGQSDETQTVLGLVLLGGVDFFVGPGAALVELAFGLAHADGYLVRDTNLDLVSLSLGYRWIF